MQYNDFTFNASDYGQTEHITGAKAIIQAIKNIILSKPGNFPLTPDCSVDISQYQFDILDDYKLNEIKSNILKQISRFVPNTDNLILTVDKVEETINDEDITGIGVRVTDIVDGVTTTADFLIVKQNENISIFDEIHN